MSKANLTLTQSVCECVRGWVNASQRCEALWIKALYKCSPFTILCTLFSAYFSQYIDSEKSWRFFCRLSASPGGPDGANVAYFVRDGRLSRSKQFSCASERPDVTQEGCVFHCLAEFFPRPQAQFDGWNKHFNDIMPMNLALMRTMTISHFVWEEGGRLSGILVCLECT